MSRSSAIVKLLLQGAIIGLVIWAIRGLQTDLGENLVLGVALSTGAGILASFLIYRIRRE